jgi:hypothetical protein
MFHQAHRIRGSSDIFEASISTIQLLAEKKQNAKRAQLLLEPEFCSESITFMHIQALGLPKSRECGEATAPNLLSEHTATLGP